MAVATAPDPATPTQSNGSLALFAYEVSIDGRTIMEMVGVAGDGFQVRVEAEVRSVHTTPDIEPERRSYVFPTREHAQVFADDTVTAFEYLGCTVSDFSLMRS